MIYMIKRGNLLVPINPPKSWLRQKPNGKIQPATSVFISDTCPTF